MPEPLQIHTLVSIPFAENTYVVWQPPREDALVFDPGLEPDAVLEFLRGQGLTPALVLNTHGHADSRARSAAPYRSSPLSTRNRSDSMRSRQQRKASPVPRGSSWRTASQRGTRVWPRKYASIWSARE